MLLTFDFHVSLHNTQFPLSVRVPMWCFYFVLWFCVLSTVPSCDDCSFICSCWFLCVPTLLHLFANYLNFVLYLLRVKKSFFFMKYDIILSFYLISYNIILFFLIASTWLGNVNCEPAHNINFFHNFNYCLKGLKSHSLNNK